VRAVRITTLAPDSCVKLACCLALLASACAGDVPPDDAIVGTWATLGSDGQLAPPYYTFSADGSASWNGAQDSWKRIDAITIEISPEDCLSGDCTTTYRVGVADDRLGLSSNLDTVLHESPSDSDALAGSRWVSSARTVYFPGLCLGSDWRVLTLSIDGTYEIVPMGACAANEFTDHGVWTETTLGFDLDDAERFARVKDSTFLVEQSFQRVTLAEPP